MSPAVDSAEQPATTSRRTVLRTSAWAVPVVAAAVAVPSAAASTPCAPGGQWLLATSIPGVRSTLQVEIPACATQIVFTVVGGAGGRSSTPAVAGGPGAKVTGIMTKQPGSPITLTLVAGQGGWGYNRTGSYINQHPLGQGSGGIGTNRHAGQRGWFVESGYGGAGSAILLSGAVLVLAGGGGGAGSARSSNEYPSVAGAGGTGKLHATAGGNGTAGAANIARGGSAAMGPNHGAGGTAEMHDPHGYSANGGSGSGTVGGRGAQTANHDGVAGGGGGGGGSAAGGGGAVVWDETNDSGAGGGGGAGSNFIAATHPSVGVIVSEITAGNDVGHGPGYDGAPGQVMINWS